MDDVRFCEITRPDVHFCNVAGQCWNRGCSAVVKKKRQREESAGEEEIFAREERCNVDATVLKREEWKNLGRGMKKIGRDPREEKEYVAERVRKEDKNQS